MALVPGTRLGVYEIAAPIGEGGMGQVFRARDTKLDRDVAIKILPEAFAHDADRVARFTREAKTLASLNHPHIAAIYGLEESSGVTALVMELVEGDDLSQRLARGAIPVEEALPIATQIAEALEAAHEQGIIHRDLKPANIKVRSDGTVKVLDFGLAKALDPAASSTPGLSMSPTITTPAMTQAGMILGTAAYMAPEQARGKAVDKRADIWAFGAVLFEMLTGTRAFDGEDVADTLGNVMKVEPNWQQLPASVPPRVVQVLRACLQKHPKQRLDSAQSVRLALDGAFETAAPQAATRAIAAPQPVWRRALPIATTAVIVGAVASVIAWSLQPAPPPAPIVTRFPIVLPADQAFTRQNSDQIAVSPDGSRIAYAANQQLYLREMGDTEARPIPGSRTAEGALFFSPDGRSIGFWSQRNRQLETIAVSGGSPVVLCKLQELPWGTSWFGNTVVFATPGEGIMRVPASGGEPEVVVKATAGEFADSPQMLDEGRLMYTLVRGNDGDRWDKGEIVVQSLATGERRVVLRGGSAARFVPTGLGSASRAKRRSGHLLFMAGNTLRAVPFDLERLEAIGTPVPVAEPVARGRNLSVERGVAQYDVSATGLLAFVPGGLFAVQPRSLALVGLDGRVERIPLPPQQYIHPRISPDGRRLAVVIDDGKNADVSVYDLAAGGALRRLSFGGRNLFPIWTRDGRFITYQSDREGDFGVFRQLADGSGPAERLTKPEPGERHEPESWSADGKALSINNQGKGGTQSVWVFPVEPNATPLAIPNATPTQKHSTFSPDGRWIAYMANVDGDISVYAQPFPPTGAKFQAAGAGTRAPVWSADGKRLFFHSNITNQLFFVDVHAEQGLTFGTPVTLPIEGTIHPTQQRNYDVMPDGKRLLVVLPAAEVKNVAVRDMSFQINVTLNWFEELKSRAPVR